MTVQPGLSCVAVWACLHFQRLSQMETWTDVLSLALELIASGPVLLLVVPLAWIVAESMWSRGEPE